MLFDQVGLQGGRDLVDRLERLIYSPISGLFVDHGASIQRERPLSLCPSAEPG
jgi:hypothetical protein